MAKKAKYVYGVTLYYHSNCEVIVESDKPLDRYEAIDAAYSKVSNQKYHEQLTEGLQEDDDADVATYEAEDYPFDKKGRLIEVYDHVMWNDKEQGSFLVGQVFECNSDMVKVKASWGGEYELFPKECTIVEV